MSSFKMNPNWERDLKHEITTNDKVATAYTDAIRDITCKEHGEHPQVIQVPDEGWGIKACCEVTKTAAFERLVEKGLVKRG